MRRRAIGSTSLVVSELGFGCARLGGIFHTGPTSEIVRTVRTAIDGGITFFDTSDLYSQGESERLLGEALVGHRNEVIIASKVGYVLPTRRRLAAGLKPVLRPIIRSLGLRRGTLARRASGGLTQDFSPAHITGAIDASLRRLRTDHLDLYQLHSPPTALLEGGEFLEPLERLKRAGKIRYYGVSCETTQDAEICLRFAAISSLQVRLSLLAQDIANTVLPSAAARGLGVIARECFAGGLLSSDGAASRAGVDASVAARVEAFRVTAERHGRTLAEVALQFAFAVPGVSIVLIGMRTGEQVRANLEALARPALSASELAELRGSASTSVNGIARLATAYR